MVYYFAYGSNMNPIRMMRRGVEIRHKEAAILTNFKLVFNKVSGKIGMGYANIIPEQKSEVEGILYEITEKELRLIDYHEGFPVHYRRELIEVENADGNLIIANVYIANPKFTSRYLKPHEGYLQHLLVGAYQTLSEEYFNKLLKIKTF